MWLHDVLNGMHRSAGGRDQKFRMTMTYFESKTQRDFFPSNKRGAASHACIV